MPLNFDAFAESISVWCNGWISCDSVLPTALILVLTLFGFVALLATERDDAIRYTVPIPSQLEERYPWISETVKDAEVCECSSKSYRLTSDSFARFVMAASTLDVLQTDAALDLPLIPRLPLLSTRPFLKLLERSEDGHTPPSPNDVKSFAPY